MPFVKDSGGNYVWKPEQAGTSKPAAQRTQRARRGESTLDYAAIARRGGMEREAREYEAPAKLSALQRVGKALTAFESSDAIYGSLYEDKPFLKEYAGNIVSSLKEAVTGRIDPNEEPDKTFKDILVREGMRDRPGKLDPVDVAGFFGDVLTDPTTFLGGAIGKGAMKGVTFGGKLLKNVPVAGDAVRGLEQMFVPFAKVRALGKAGTEYEDRVRKLWKGVSSSQDDFADAMASRLEKAGGSDAGKKIGEAIETGTKTGDTLLDGVMDEMIAVQETLTRGELKRGILTRSLPNYVHHMLTPQARDYMNKGGDVARYIKPIRVKLGSAKERGIIGVIDEAGKKSVTDFRKAGLKKINKASVLSKMETEAARTTARLQKATERLLSPEIKSATSDLSELISDLRRNISQPPKLSVVDELAEPTEKELESIVQSIVSPKRDQMKLLIKDLEDQVRLSQGLEMMKPTLSVRASRRATAKRVNDQILEIQNKLAEGMRKIESNDLIDSNGKMYKYASASTREINETFRKKHGFDLFEEDAFKAFAKRGMDGIKAVKVHDFLQVTGRSVGVKSEGDFVRDGIRYVEPKVPQLKGIRVPEPIAQHLDEVSGMLSGDEATNGFLRAYDKVQNLWKSSVTGWFPSFHTRNAVGGVFNNWLAGVKNPADYATAERIIRGSDGYVLTSAGNSVTYKELKKLAREHGVLGNVGSLDVQKLSDRVGRSAAKKFLETPRAVGAMVEDRLRMTLFMDGIRGGMKPVEAAKRVIKYHFDYTPAGLTAFENNVMRRIIPFYTFTRNNVPLQLEQLIMQPSKYAAMYKAQRSMGVQPSAEETETLPKWLREKFSIKVDGGYLSNVGIPFEEAMKFVSDPLYGLGTSIGPLIKVPIEQLTGYNLFTEKNIDEDTYGAQYKNMPKFLKEWLEMKEFRNKDGSTYYRVNPRKKYWLQVVGARGLSTAAKLANVGTETKSAWDVLKSLATTVQKYEYDPDQLAEYVEREKADKIEKALLEAGLLREFSNTYEPSNEVRGGSDSP